MKFKCFNMIYEILEVSEKKLKEEYVKDHPRENKDDIYVFGHTNYTKHIIKISKDLNEEEKIKTLKHELCHCWMWNTANSGQTEYNEEHICEIVACSNDFINEVIEQYLKIKKLYICDPKRNEKCNKKNCYINGGQCTCTTNIKYAKRYNNEH